MGADGTLVFDTKINESGFNSGVKKIGSLLKVGTGAITGAAAVAGVAISTLALDSVANLEQNIGGVKTLFKDSANDLIKNANKAYKTAGMSANKYMETATSFSASLLQSLENDTAKAVDYADKAIKDMSDNANKFGSDIDTLRTAYSGFAKGQFMLLDNLKLGYGGTKEEMQRLIEHANRVKEANGEMADLSIESFADIVEAIHIVQEEMGITGATADEAMTTIEGSVNAAKAAWDNFMNGSGSAEEFADAFVVAAENIIVALGEIVLRLAETMPEAIARIVEGLGASIEENAPLIMEKGGYLLTEFINGIAEKMPELTQQGSDMIVGWLEAITAKSPSIIETGTEVVNVLTDSIIENAPNMIQQGGIMLMAFVQAIITLLASVVHAGLEIVYNLVSGILSKAGEVPYQAMVMIAEFITAIIDKFGEIIQTGIDMIASFISGIQSKVGEVIEEASSLINDFIGKFTETNWAEVGSNLISGIAGGIAGAAGELASSAVSAVRNAWNAMTSWLDMHSPSKKARDFIGKNWIKGIGIGFEDETPNLEKIGENSMKDVFATMQGLSKNATSFGASMATSTGNVLKSVHGNYTGSTMDYKKMEKAVKAGVNEANARPLSLDGRVLSRGLAEEGFVMA